MKRVALLLCVASAASAKPAQKPPRPSRAPAESVQRLGRGARLFEAGDYAKAARELAPLADSKLKNRDLALWLLAESEALSGSRAQALAHFRALGQSKEAGPRAELARARAADLAFALGKLDDAERGYRAAEKLPDTLVERAVVRFRLAEIEEKRGAKDKAAALYRLVVDERPDHPLADRALARMKAIDPQSAVQPVERVERAKVLTNNREWQRALDELGLVPTDAPQAVRDEADYWIGTDHFRMRRGYDVAAEKLLAVAARMKGDRQTEALFHGARAWSRADQDDRAIAGYRDLVARFPHARQAPEASFLVGWLEYNRGRYKEALPGLEETMRRYGSSPFGEEARWYHGFSRWLLGDVAGALDDFDALGKRPGALEGGKGRYWKGRALDKLGKRDAAVDTWRKLVTDFPFSYYATQARARLKELGVAVGPFGDAPAKLVPPLGRVDESLAGEPAIARADELLAAGLPREAIRELDAGDRALIAKYGAPRALPLLFDRYQKAGGFFQSHRLAEAFANGALRQDPAKSPGARQIWELVYPRAYRAFVEKYAPTGGNPPYYLYTIMQKESAYNPHDVSYADAIGLLQMIPPTSRRVGERIGRPYTDDVLYDPEGNIQFGAWYIGHLLNKFKRQIAIGAGSYNAGPKAMQKWLTKNGQRPLDEFIELCAYTQTREYMKKVLDIYARYLYLYEHEDYLPEAKVDPAWKDDDGIDY